MPMQSSFDQAFLSMFERFAYQEVPNEPGQALDSTTQYLTILAVLVGCGGVDTFKDVVHRALDDNFSPIMVKEIVYQATAYLGMGRVAPFLDAANDALSAALPLPDQSTTTQETRREMGTKAQVAIFGEGMRNAWRRGAVNKWLAANCFGDYYTRTGLTLSQRELITFCFLYAQGACEPQLLSHIKGNLNMGNDAALLSRVVARSIPFIGYPRSLNALSAIQKATNEEE